MRHSFQISRLTNDEDQWVLALAIIEVIVRNLIPSIHELPRRRTPISQPGEHDEGKNASDENAKEETI